MGWKGCLALGIGIVAFVGLGTLVPSEDDERVSATDLREARAVVDGYVDAYARHDGAAICAALVPEAREALARSNDRADCAAAMAQRSRPVEDSPRGRPNVRVRDAREAGFEGGIYAALDWPGGEGAGLAMQQVDGRWLLAEDLSCVTPSCQP